MNKEDMQSGWGWSTFSGSELRIWQTDITGKHTNEAMFDPYSFLHAFSGSLQFVLIPPFWLVEFNNLYLLLNFMLHLGFEVAENTPLVIRMCRHIDTEYVGDSVLNTIGDLVSFLIGYTVSYATWKVSSPSYVFIFPTASFLIFLSFYIWSGKYVQIYTPFKAIKSLFA